MYLFEILFVMSFPVKVVKVKNVKLRMRAHAYVREWGNSFSILDTCWWFVSEIIPFRSKVELALLSEGQKQNKASEESGKLSLALLSIGSLLKRSCRKM